LGGTPLRMDVNNPRAKLASPDLAMRSHRKSVQIRGHSAMCLPSLPRPSNTKSFDILNEKQYHIQTDWSIIAIID
jgi:hypothetical protein